MDFIEFITRKDKKKHIQNEGYFSLILLQSSTVVEVLIEDKESCRIRTSLGQEYLVVGSYRCVTNRLLYSRGKHKIINMAILKPSDFFYHRIEELQQQTDNIYYDTATMNALYILLKSEIFTFRGTFNFDQPESIEKNIEN